MPKVAFVERVFNRVHGFWGKKSCFSGKLQREKLLLCRGRTCAARSCKVNGHLREGRGPGACRRTTSADSLQANTLVRLFAPQGQTLFAPRFRSTQPWSYAHTPAMPGPYRAADCRGRCPHRPAGRRGRRPLTFTVFSAVPPALRAASRRPSCRPRTAPCPVSPRWPSIYF